MTDRLRIVHLVPGSGGGFYCQNCLRDMAMVRALRDFGHDVVAVPMYLPWFAADETGGREGDAPVPVFFGAVRTWLKEQAPWAGSLAEAVRGCLDHPAVLRWAGRQAASTRARGLEEMTLSMLRGTAGRQADEIARLVDWLRQEPPDLVQLSNGLLLGLAEPLRRELRIPVACLLQDEDQWVDAMPEDYAWQVWAAMAEKAADVDGFMAVSEAYAERMSRRLGLPRACIAVVRPGIDAASYVPSPRPLAPPVIGYLSRLAPALGLDILAEAFILLRETPPGRHARLHATGGMLGGDADFVAKVRRRLVAAGVGEACEFRDEFATAGERRDFLAGLTLMAGPAPCGEAFGFFALEAMAAGVPVVLAEAGGFPELVAMTGGGLTCPPGDPAALAAALAALLADPPRLLALGHHGREAVAGRFGLRRMAAEISAWHRGMLAPA